jgi:hypothetical protein
MPFATIDDVTDRLGRDLTEQETTIATWAIATVEDLIAEALGKDSDWADAVDPIPATLSAIVVEKTVGLIVNPTNVASDSETLGAHSYSRTFPRSADIGIFLSRADRARARRAVSGTGLLSIRTPTALEEFLEDLS